MMLKLMNEFKKKRKENKGAALIMVIVAIAFIGMLVAMILYMSYCNYLMKGNDRKAKDNFYTAEYALDIINAGLQHDISDCMSAAYVKTMQSAKGQTNDEMTMDFKSYYLDELKKRILVTGTTDKWNVTHLTDMWTNAGMTVASAPGDNGAYLTDESGLYPMTVASNGDYITLGQLHIVCNDANKGYISIINTDIRLKVPSIDFAQSATKMSVENFSIIANDALVNDNNNDDEVPSGITVSKGSDVVITGNVFGGYDGVEVGNQKKTEFTISAADEAQATPPTFNLITESLNVTNALNGSAGLYVDDSFVTYVNDINLETARLSLAGTAYVGDDMDISGRGCIVNLSGIYRGYGNSLGRAQGSSSILINGANTTLNFAGLDELTLSGHAYVGARRYDADVDRLAYAEGVTDKSTMTDDVIEDPDAYDEALSAADSTYTETDDTIPQNTSDVMMGESISVKANQLLYMVPSECVGFLAGTDTQVLAKNPMTYEEYKMLTDTETTEPELNPDGTEKKDAAGNTIMKKMYDPVRLAALWNKLGGVAYTSDYKAVYRRVNGMVMVYLYLDFGSNETMANEFFKAYQAYDPEGVENYVNAYISNMTWNNALTSSSAELTLAGNSFTIDSQKKMHFVENSMTDSDKYLNMIKMQEQYEKAYEAMMHSLSSDYNLMTSSQANSEIFDSLVPAKALNELAGKTFTDGTVSAIISKNDVVYNGDAAGSPKTAVIVTDKNVYLKADFKGLVIAGGKVYICAGCSNVDYDPTLTVQALRTFYTDINGKNVYAYEIFGDSGKVTYGVVTQTSEKETVDLDDLIVYQNWKKE